MIRILLLILVSASIFSLTTLFIPVIALTQRTIFNDNPLLYFSANKVCGDHLCIKGEHQDGEIHKQYPIGTGGNHNTIINIEHNFTDQMIRSYPPPISEDCKFYLFWFMEKFPPQDVYGKKLFFGDSLVMNFSRYSGLYSPDYFADGLGGNKAVCLPYFVDPILSMKPPKILVYLGVNDANHQSGVPDTRKALEAYQYFVQSMKSQHVEVIIHGVHLGGPVNNKEYIKQFNRGLEQIAKKYDLQYIPPYFNFSTEEMKNNTLTSDGIHLTHEGYLEWATYIKKILKDF